MTTHESTFRYRGLELLVAYHQQPSIEARNQLVKLHAGLVRKLAHRVSYQCAEPYEDLEQVGYLGLIRAIERFDPTQGCAFSSFAVPYIRGEILHFLRDRSGAVRIPRRWQQLHKAGQAIRASLFTNLGRQPNDEEIAQALQISLEEWQECKLVNRNRIPLSLDATASHQTDSYMALGDTLPDLRFAALQTREEERQQVQGALSQLEEKTREAIEFVFFRNLSRKEVAERTGVSPMTVTRRIQRGIQQMITLIEPQVLQIDP
ncbi:RNA polymerase sigma factor SigF [Neosynechococcus sphagnicola sy1]|uniref:RNA polymerase sigma factor SigF n=1 Tax=Neosynechococcus sphagnicola sy1 TaxID=1497020 RepID=A0A098TNL3_9CYAN|nr:RNA polymerase sigma factor SigF [Neosynechococcus sphagnicola]KGF73457.1 RNA polymerase sigma factor SigF [Neosynechococcus sphagnicola sy1]